MFVLYKYFIERWVNFMEGDVCFGVFGNEFVIVVILMEGFFLLIKLVYVIGYVLCSKSLY